MCPHCTVLEKKTTHKAKTRIIIWEVAAMIKSEGDSWIFLWQGKTLLERKARKGCAKSQVNKLETGTKFSSLLPKWLLTIFASKFFVWRFFCFPPINFPYNSMQCFPCNFDWFYHQSRSDLSSQGIQNFGIWSKLVFGNLLETRVYTSSKQLTLPILEHRKSSSVLKKNYFFVSNISCFIFLFYLYCYLNINANLTF